MNTNVITVERGNPEVKPVPPFARFKLARILVPVDFSNCSDKAVQYAVPLAKEFGAELSLLHVIKPYPPTPGMSPVDAEAIDVANKELEAVQARIEEQVSSKVFLRKGNPSIEIVEAAKELEVDLIAISTHGRTGLAHMLLGSTAEQVVRHAPCPVLVLHGSEHSSCKPARANPVSEARSEAPSRLGAKFRIMPVVLLMTFVIAASLSGVAQSRRSRVTKEFMRDKLELSQQVLEGLAMEDFDLITAKASKLSAMTQEADWRAFENPDYDRYSSDFRRHVEAVRKAAEARNLDGATLAYVKMTMSCVECHKFVRGKKVAAIRHETPLP